MLEIIFYTLSTFLLMYGLYFFITSLFAFLKDKKEIVDDSTLNKFAIIIAARNEEKVIGNLIDSLKKQDYNKNKYEIDVIVNNCTDNTREVALSHGANVIDCEIKVKSKGEVLRYTFNKLKNRKLDAYIIFDADNVVDKNFLKHMNRSLNKGYNVAQGYRDSKNYSDNWISGSYTLFYYLQNFFFNISRKKVGLSASINGTGFMVRKSFIENIDFNPKTMTEDVELTGICAILNEKIDFVKDAITYDEQPTSFKESWKQRLRWSKGNLQCFMYYHKELIKSLFKTNNLSCLDMFLNYSAPITQTLSFVLFLILFISNIKGLELNKLFLLLTSQNVLITILSYIASILILMFIVKYNKKEYENFISSFLLFSLFIYSWIPINIVCLFKKNIKWAHIEHNKSINIDNLMKATK